MRLADLQRAFARRILDGDDAILAELDQGRLTDRSTLMRVYEHAYGARLAEVLAADYEKLAQALGEEAFLALAAAYVAARPSMDPNARYFGRHMPAFLAETAPWAERPWLAELAALEWAMGEVFQAEDPPRLAIEAMAALHPHDWPSLRFDLPTDIRRLDCRHGGPEAWLALDAGAEPAPVTEDEPTPWLVWREDARAAFRAMAPGEGWMFDRAREGALFADLCDGLLEWTAGDAGAAAGLAAGYLRAWIDAGLVSGFAVDDHASG